MEFALVVFAVLTFIAFRQWLRHQRRVLIHKERLAAIEKGTALPEMPGEPEKGRLNVQRILLLSGLIWLAVGIGGMIAGSVILADPAIRAMPEALPPTAYLGGLIPILIGLAHLIVYFVDRSHREGNA